MLDLADGAAVAVAQLLYYLEVLLPQVEVELNADFELRFVGVLGPGASLAPT